MPMSAPKHGAATRNIRQPSPNQEVFIIGNGEAGWSTADSEEY